jgi:hypothetical protein
MATDTPAPKPKAPGALSRIADQPADAAPAKPEPAKPAPSVAASEGKPKPAEQSSGND